jgi:propanol-preferring alcohol dehydrogenase
VFRTLLHLFGGDLLPKRPRVVPRHEVVGHLDAASEGATRFAVGDRVGVPWLAHTRGVCGFCWTGRENLCVDPRFTGWDPSGGYPEYLMVDEAYAYPLPEDFD